MDASSKGSNFIWTKATMKILIDVCLQYRQKYGRNQKFQWPHILKDFEKVSGKKANQNSMKNKYDNMKKEYSAWMSLHSETGLGWNASTRTIIADDAWWDKKIKENPNCKKYRINPLPADIEDWWAQLFGDNVATGEYCVAPSMDPIEGIEAEEGGVAQEQTADSLEDYSFRDLYRIMNEGIEQAPTQHTQPAPSQHTKAPPSSQHTQAPALSQHTQAPAPSQNTQGPASTQATTSSNSKKDQKLVKRKKRQSEGSLKLAQHLERVEAVSSQTLAMIGSVTSSSVNQRNASEDQLVEALRLLDKMADEGCLTPASPMWCFAAEKITDDKSRVLFLNMRDDATRLSWIQWAYTKQG